MKSKQLSAFYFCKKKKKILLPPIIILWIKIDLQTSWHSLDQSLGHHGTQHTHLTDASPSQAQHRRDIHPFMLEFVNLESPNNLTWLTLDCWGKSEYLERIHAGKLLVVLAAGSVSVSPKFAPEAQQWPLSPVTVQDNGVWVCLTGWQ